MPPKSRGVHSPYQDVGGGLSFLTAVPFILSRRPPRNFGGPFLHSAAGKVLAPLRPSKSTRSMNSSCSQTLGRASRGVTGPRRCPPAVAHPRAMPSPDAFASTAWGGLEAAFPSDAGSNKEANDRIISEKEKNREKHGTGLKQESLVLPPAPSQGGCWAET